jgi:Tfp pilus assembly protein PilN
VNVNPSTATGSKLDEEVKFWMLRDLFHLAGIPAFTNSDRLLQPVAKSAQKRPNALTTDQKEFKLAQGEKRYGDGKNPTRYEKLVLETI